jgi:uncharacterized protein YndB with AHSA1/START domain
MSSETQSFEFTQTIQATPAQVFYAFTNATALKEWMCDVATLSPKSGGRIYLAWNSGFYASGEFTIYEADKELAFTWFGRGEPAPTLVEVTLTPEHDQTHLKVIHGGLGSGEAWENMVQEVKEGWSSSLENLASVLENGPDLRVVLRPMLGIVPGEFDKQTAEHLGVPAAEGIRLDSVLETMGAYAAGLRKDDVIVGIDEKATTDNPSLTNALNGHRAGDKVEVVFYRGPEKKVTLMELSRRPLPDLPPSVAELAEVIKKRYEALQTRLDQLLADVSESESAHKPTPEAWSVKEVLVHLIHGERDGQAYTTELIGGQVRWADDYAGNLAVRTNATLSALPTLQELRAELKRLYAESTALYENIPVDFPIQRKGTYWGMAYYAVQPTYHEDSHYEQMQEAINSARA